MTGTIKKIPVANIRSEYEILSLFVGLLVSFVFLLIFMDVLGYFYFVLYIILALVSIISYQGQFMGSNLQVSAQNFPELKKMIERQAIIAGIPEPNLFIRQSPEPNAFCTGLNHPYSMVLHSSIIEYFTPSEIETIIGHELGHIYFGHPRVLSILSAFESMPFNILFLPIQLGFWSYRRQTEKSSDRFAISMTENPRAFVTSLIKISVGPKLINQIDEVALLNQSLEIQKNQKHRIGEWFSTHPYTINRIAYTIRFSNENRMYYRREESVYCINCGKMIKLPAKYCDDCGWVIEP